jgi:hypothetical protein
MGTLSKSLTLVLIFIVVWAGSSMLIGQFANAQSIPKPTVPEFTLNFTGCSVSTIAGEERSSSYFNVNLTIQNQPLTYTAPDGTNYTICYQIRAKNHFNDTWQELTRGASTLDTTVTGFAVTANSSWIPPITWGLTSNGNVLIDFQVRADLANTVVLPDRWNFLYDRLERGGVVTNVAESSDWSNTKTITIPQSALVTPIPPPTSSPTNPSDINQTPTDGKVQGIMYYLPFTLIVLLFVTIIGVAVVYGRRSRNKGVSSDNIDEP